MIVTYGGANVMYLPLGKGSGNFKFTPGVNTLNPKQWKGIQAGIATRDKLRPGVQEHYDNCLCVIGGKEQKGSSLVIGPDEIDFLALHSQEAVKLVTGTVDMETLEGFQTLEKGNERPRNAVLKAIAAQVREIKTFHKNIADSKKGD